MNIYEYTNYREYVRAQVMELRQTADFSFRTFSMAAGFKSPNFLKLVMDGQRNLSLEGARKVAKGFGLNNREREYFESLVLANQAKDLNERQELTDQLLKLKSKNSDRSAVISDYDYYKYWYNIAVREGFLVDQTDQSMKRVAESFCPPLLPSQIEAATKTLSALGMIEKNNKGKWIPTKESIHTDDFFMNSMIVSYHLKMMDLGKESLSQFRGAEREIGAVTVGLSAENFEKVRQLIREFREQVIEIAEKDKNKKDIYQMNVQFFPLTKGLKK